MPTVGRGFFYINIPIGVISVLLVLAFLPEASYYERGLARIDVVGIVLLVVGLTTLQLFLERGEREDWFQSPFIICAAVIALASLTALVLWELWVEEPVVNLRVLKNLPFVGGVSMGLFFGLTTFGSIFILPLFLQQIRGYTVLDSGLIQMPRMLVVLFVAPIAGKVYGRLDSRLFGLLRHRHHDGRVSRHVAFHPGGRLGAHAAGVVDDRRRHGVHVQRAVGGDDEHHSATAADRRFRAVHAVASHRR